MPFSVKQIKNNNGEIVDGPLLLKTKSYKDARGFFMESWNKKELSEILKKETLFVQDNHSKSHQGVLRGLHFQIPPYAQGKLVRCISGEIYDVGVDIRLNSVTFGTWFYEKLSSENLNQLWIPEGFAHGFITISSIAEVLYKTTNYWNQNSERSINWSDPNIDIQWPKLPMDPILSAKDFKAPFLKNINQNSLFK